MAYISTEEVKHIRNALEQIPEYKFQRYERRPSWRKDCFYGRARRGSHMLRLIGILAGVVWTGEGYYQLNHKWAVDFYSEENGKIIEKVVKIARLHHLVKVA